MCQARALRIYVELHPDSGTFEFLVVQQLDAECSNLEHDELLSYSNGPSALCSWLTEWTRAAMAEPSRC